MNTMVNQQGLDVSFLTDTDFYTASVEFEADVRAIIVRRPNFTTLVYTSSAPFSGDITESEHVFTGIKVEPVNGTALRLVVDDKGGWTLQTGEVKGFFVLEN